MITKYLAEHDVIGATVIEALDGGLMMMYSSVDGKHFLKSYDHFRTVQETWVVPIDSITACANLLRMKDGRLMTIVRRLSEDADVAAIAGASFYTFYSEDDGHTFYEGEKINKREACYYVMNDRILRTKSGRIVVPMCYVPSEFAEKELFEKTGLSGCFYSDDEGKSWVEGKWLQEESVDQLAEPMVAQEKNGVLHMYMRTGHGYLYHSVSYDDGYSWEKAQASPLRSPCAPFCVKYDPFSKDCFVVWDNSFPGLHQNYPRSPICMAKSHDGINWEMICELDNDPMRSYGYPMLFFTENEIIVAYYEAPGRRFDRVHQKLKVKIIGRGELEQK